MRNYTPAALLHKAWAETATANSKGQPKRDLIVIFTTDFLGELATRRNSPRSSSQASRMPALPVFVAAAGALVTSKALAVVVGETGQHYLMAIPLKLIAGLGFIAIGAWTVVQYYRGA